jgi:DNA-directed RNA polymerase subunit H (RpoH/RPB5)
MNSQKILFKSMQTIKMMFSSRRYYELQSPEKLTIKKKIFLRLRAKFDDIRENKRQKNVVCFWIPVDCSKMSSSAGINEVTQLFSTLNKDTDHVIFISKSVTYQAVSFLNDTGLTWEVLSYEDTMCAKDTHQYVPKYDLLSEEEIQVVEKKYGSRHKFKKMISVKDAMARYLNFRPGDVVKTTQCSAIGGLCTSYRILISPDEIL